MPRRQCLIHGSAANTDLQEKETNAHLQPAFTPCPSLHTFLKSPARKNLLPGKCIVDSTWFVPPPSREKIWREELSLGLVQNESKAHRLISICTKPRKSFSRQTLSLDKPSGIDNTACCKKVETLVSSRADLFNLRKQVPARPAAALWRADSPGAGGTGRSTCRGVSTRRTRLARGKRGNRGPTQT